jgi:hypothetical protein
MGHKPALRESDPQYVGWTCRISEGWEWEAEGSSNRVQWAADAAGTATEDVGVDHGGADGAVAEELLDGAEVMPSLEEVGGEGVAAIVPVVGCQLSVVRAAWVLGG